MTSIKITVEKHPDGYVAYPLGLSGAVVGQGDSYEAAPPMCTRRSRSTSKRSAPRLWSRIRQCSRRSSLDDRRIAMVRGQRGRHSHSAHSPRAPDHQEIHAARDLHAVTRSASTSTGLQSTRGLKHRPPRWPLFVERARRPGPPAPTNANEPRSRRAGETCACASSRASPTPRPEPVDSARTAACAHCAPSASPEGEAQPPAPRDPLHCLLSRPGNVNLDGPTCPARVWRCGSMLLSSRSAIVRSGVPSGQARIQSPCCAANVPTTRDCRGRAPRARQRGGA